MIDMEMRAQIRRLFYVEHWKIGTIACELGFHPETVGLAVETDRFNNAKTLRRSVTDPYADFIREILGKHPSLRATRIFQMIRDRGYGGSVVQLRRFVALFIGKRFSACALSLANKDKWTGRILEKSQLAALAAGSPVL
jgi:hypothetical protein